MIRFCEGVGMTAKFPRAEHPARVRAGDDLGGKSPARFLSASAAADSALYARLDALEAHPVLRGPLDLIEAREDHARRLTLLVDAVAAFLVNDPHGR